MVWVVCEVNRFFDLPEVLCSEIELHDLLFRKHHLNVSRFVGSISDPRGVNFLMLGLVLLFLVDPNDLRSQLGPVWAAVLLTTTIALYLLLLCLLLVFFAYTQNRLGRYRIYTPLASAIPLSLVYFIVQLFKTWIAGLQTSDEILPSLLEFLLIGQVVETLYLRFVLADDAPTAATAPSDVLLIGDHHVRLSQVTFMTAQEHHIDITTTSQRITVRARLRDALAQTDAQDGIQPHRSWWVSKQARPVMRRYKGKPFLQLSDGTTAPIARGRLRDVEDWLSRNQKW